MPASLHVQGESSLSRHCATLETRLRDGRGDSARWKARFTVPLTVQKIRAKREPAFTLSAAPKQLAPTVNLMQLFVAYCPLPASLIRSVSWSLSPRHVSSSAFIKHFLTFLFKVRVNLVPRYHSPPVLRCLLRHCRTVFIFCSRMTSRTRTLLEEQGLV